MSRFDEPGLQCMTGHLLRRNNLNAANATMAKSAFTLAKGKTGDEAGDAGHTYVHLLLPLCMEYMYTCRLTDIHTSVHV